MSTPRPREIRLRPEFSDQHPGLPPGEWVPATQWVDVIVSRAQEARREGIHRRTFDPRHFEFRGGLPPRGARGGHLRTRAEDP